MEKPEIDWTEKSSIYVVPLIDEFGDVEPGRWLKTGTSAIFSDNITECFHEWGQMSVDNRSNAIQIGYPPIDKYIRNERSRVMGKIRKYEEELERMKDYHLKLGIAITTNKLVGDKHRELFKTLKDS